MMVSKIKQDISSCDLQPAALLQSCSAAESGVCSSRVSQTAGLEAVLHMRQLWQETHMLTWCKLWDFQGQKRALQSWLTSL